MSIYNMNYNNQIDTRVRDGMFQKLYVLNPTSDQYERVIPGGGGGPSTLPYYLGTNSINMQDGSRYAIDLSSKEIKFKDDSIEAVVNTDFINTTNAANITTAQNTAAITNILNNELPPIRESMVLMNSELSDINNVVLPAYEASIEQVDAKANNNTADINVMKPIVTDLNTVKTGAVTTTRYMNLLGTMADSTNKLIKTNQIRFGSSIEYALLASARLTVGNATASVRYGSTSVGFVDGTGTIYFDKTGVVAINNLKSLNDVGTSEISNKKMVVYDPTTSVYNYTTIPSGGSSIENAQYTSFIQFNGSFLTNANATDTGKTQNITDALVVTDPSFIAYPKPDGCKAMVFDFKDRDFYRSGAAVNTPAIVYIPISNILDPKLIEARYLASPNDSTNNGYTLDYTIVPITYKTTSTMSAIKISLTSTSSSTIRLKGSLLIRLASPSDLTNADGFYITNS